jgi:general secretion pathway protein H
MRDGTARAGGFTLIEILVVIVIMAVVISIAVLSISTTGRDTQVDRESQRIEGLIEMLHERALIEGRDFGLRLEPTAYEFDSYDTLHGLWVPLNQEQEFRRRSLPPGLEFQLELDSRQVVLVPRDPDAVNSSSLLAQSGSLLAQSSSQLGNQAGPAASALTAAQQAALQQGSTIAPQLAIAASGDSTPFRITLLRADTQSRALISGDAMGRITLRSSDQPNLPDRPAGEKSS